MVDLPIGLGTGLVEGQFIIATIDKEDPDQEPDVIAASGRVNFTMGVDYTAAELDSGPVTVMSSPISAVLDEEGYICTPDPGTGLPMYRGIRLIGNDDDRLSVKGWTWQVEYKFNKVGVVTPKIPTHSMSLGVGEVKDLARVVKIPSTPGYGLPQAEASALRAEEHAFEAAVNSRVALEVKAAADAGEFDGAPGLPGEPGKVGAPGNATLRVDTSVGKRVFISDGTTEHLVYADTGYRDISSLLPAGITKSVSVNASPPTIRRINSTVTIELYLDVAVSGSTTIIGLMPDAFRPRAIISRPNLLWIDTTSVGRPLPSEQFPWYLSQASIRTSGAIPANSTLLLTASWDTKAAWPTTLPGTPA